MADATNAELIEAIEAAVDAAAGTVQGLIDAYNGGVGFKGYDFSTASDAVAAQIVTEFRAELEKNVTTTKAEVEKVAGLLSKSNTLASATTAYEAAAANLNAAEKALEAEAAKFDVVAGVTETASNADTLYDDTDYTTYAVSATIDGNSENIIVVDGGKVVIADGFEDLEGIDVLLAAAQAEYRALLAESSTQASLEAAILAVLKAENPDVDYFDESITTDEDAVEITYSGTPNEDDVFTVAFGGEMYSYTAASGDVSADVIQGLANAIGVDLVGGELILEDFTGNDVAVDGGLDKLETTVEKTTEKVDVADYFTKYSGSVKTDGSFDADVLEGGGTLKADKSAAYADARTALEAFNQAVADYQELEQVEAQADALAAATEQAIEALEALGVELNSTNVGTEANDLFVFTGTSDVEITGFGLQGSDQLFLGDYAVVRTEADVTGARLGDVNTLEAFFQQEGSNAVIYVEQQSFAGNTIGSNDLVKITLLGVNVADLAVENGFVSVAA